MSKAAISYNSLNDAASEASSVAKKLTTYANSLNNSVYKKLNSYSGDYTSNISGAVSKTYSKISELENKSTAYTKYASDLEDLKERCTTVDTCVKDKVSQLTADFKNANDIKNNKVINFVNNFLTSFENSTAAGRWLSNLSSKLGSVKDYVTQSIKDWWNYEGGKQLVKGVVEAALTFAASVAVVVGAIISGAGVVVLIAAVVAAVISAANFGTNIANEAKAYQETHFNGDPATGRRRSEIDTLSEGMRKDTDSSFWHNIATALDVTKVACDVIVSAKSLGKIAQKGYVWLKQGLTEGPGSFASQIKEVTTSLKSEGLSSLRGMAENKFGSFVINLRDNFLNFEDAEKGVSSLQNLLSVAKSFVQDGFNFKDIAAEIILPAVVVSEDLTLVLNLDGEEITKELGDLTLGDFYDAYDKSSKIFGEMKDILEGSGGSFDLEINSKVLEKLGEVSEINISIPEIYVPSIDLSALRAA